jgi:hypothetical protein
MICNPAGQKYSYCFSALWVSFNFKVVAAQEPTTWPDVQCFRADGPYQGELRFVAQHGPQSGRVFAEITTVECVHCTLFDLTSILLMLRYKFAIRCTFAIVCSGGYNVSWARVELVGFLLVVLLPTWDQKVRGLNAFPNCSVGLQEGIPWESLGVIWCLSMFQLVIDVAIFHIRELRWTISASQCLPVIWKLPAKASGSTMVFIGFTIRFLIFGM